MVWKYIYLSIGALFIFLLPGFSAASDAETQPVDEQEYLKLFFEEEELVEVATRSPKPVSQIAENVTIITAEEITAMNAHTVAEVLNRAAGIFVDFAGRDFANRSFIHIHGSDYEHILVLLDGIRWNHPSADSNFTNQIPVQIIKRIEIIKGPASSAWGSALGGVVNIITKDTGKSQTPSGLISGSYGEHNTQDFRAEAAGTAGPLGYYLFAGRQESDGILDNRSFDNESFYGKIDLDLGKKVDLELTLGYSNPQYKYLHIPSLDFSAQNRDRVSFFSAIFDILFSDDLSLAITVHRFKDKLTDTGRLISTGEVFDKTTYDATTKGVRGRLVLSRRGHVAVLGTELEWRDNVDIDELNNSRDPENSEEIWAVFVNDTINLGKTTITPGIRYDHLSVAKDIFSPSLGITYRLNDTNLFRFLVARGFRKPTLSLLKISPSLEKDKTWSYQAGFETTAVKYASLKTTFFHHKTDDYWEWDDDEGNYVNRGPYRRKGVELEIKTHPFYHFSFISNGTYVRLEPKNRDDADIYNANIILAYDNPEVIRARLAGHYSWWGSEFSADYQNGDYGRFIWDLALTKKVFSKQRLDGELFFTAYNLFNGNDFADDLLPSAGRWVEAGLRVYFR